MEEQKGTWKKEEVPSTISGVVVHMGSGAIIHNLTTNANIHQGDNVASTANIGPESLTEEELIKCQTEMKEYYKENCKIRLLPWLKRDRRNWINMEDLFINLYLIHEVPNAIEISVQIHNYMDILAPVSIGANRALVRGKAGSGKTTFLEKLALDWANESLPLKYSGIVLLILLKMKTLKDDVTLIDALFRQKLLGPDVERLKDKISRYIDSNPKKVMLLLDAADEYGLYGNESYFDYIIHNQALRDVHVIVTSRPWRAFQITDRSPDLYNGNNYEVKGYSQLQINKYVKKFFEKTPEMAVNLLKQMNDTGISTGIATIPIMCMLICVVFRNFKTKIPDTISALYTMLQNFMLLRHNEEKGNLEMWKEEECVMVGNLEELAFACLQKGHCWFYEDDLFDTKTVAFSREIGFIVQSNPTIDLTADISTLSFIDGNEKNYYDFFHKTFQEWLAAKYLSRKDILKCEELCKPLLTDITSCLDMEILLRFLSGINSSVAETIIKHLKYIICCEKDLNAYNENKLSLQKTKLIQEFIELILKCNQESKSEGGFNELLNSVFQNCCARFANITSTTLEAIAYMLKFGQTGNRLYIEDFKIICHVVGTNSDIDNLWGEFESVGSHYYEKCKILSNLPANKLQLTLEQVQHFVPKDIQHLSLARKLAFADLGEFMKSWEGDYYRIGSVVKNIGFTEITNLTINGINMSAHCELLCRNVKLVKSLKKFDLKCTSLEAQHCKYIGEMLESLNELHTLNLNQNKLCHIVEIVQRLKLVPNAIRLDFDVTNLTPQSISLLSQNLKYVTKLQRLYIRSSPLGNESIDDFIDGLQTITDLKRLSMTLGNLSYEGHIRLITCLRRYQNLHLLYIDGVFSPIIEKVFSLLATDLFSSLTNLRSLRIQGKFGLSAEDAKKHGISNTTAKIFADKLIKNLPNLMVLRLTYVWMEKEGLKSLRQVVDLRKKSNNSFRFEYYPDFESEDSEYVPEAA